MAGSRTLVCWSLLLAAGCKDDPKGGTDSDTVVPVEGACSPVVTIPGGLALEDEGVEADRHQAVLGEAPSPVAVRYQWPDEDPSTSAAFLWSTDTDTLASLLEIGPADTFPEGARQVEGYTFLFGGSAINTGDNRIHEVRVCGTLTPGTTYSYRVGGEGAWSDTYTFTTPGAPGTFDTFRIAIAGDSRGAYTTWGQILAKMDAAEPDLILFSGDMVDIGTNQEEWDAWLRAGGDVLARRPLVAAHGNHEFLSQNYFAQLALPGNEQWFHIRYGSMSLLSLNDTVQDSDELTVEQPAFIAQALSESDATWRVAMHHQSAYAACSTHGSDAEVRAAWAPMFDAHDVDVVFAGHNHIYERSVPIRDDAPADDGVTYIVSGGAGAPLYTNVNKEWFNAVANPTEHYIIADVSPTEIHVVVRDLDEVVIDDFTLPAD